MQIIFANGFDEFTAFSGTQGLDLDLNLMLGWESEIVSTNQSTSEPTFALSTANSSTSHLRGGSTFLQIFKGTGITVSRLKRNVVDNNRMVLGFAIKAQGISNLTNFRMGFNSVSGDKIHVGFRDVGSSVARAALYINDNLISTGTAIDAFTGLPWVYIELFVNKTTSMVEIKVSGVSECIGTMPVGFVNQLVEINPISTFSTNGGNSPFLDDVVYYIDSNPLGVLKVDGYLKTSDIKATFTDGTDNGSLSTNDVNSSLYSPYRASSTPGQEDIFAYNNILPSGVQANSILAVIPSVISSTGNYNAGKLELLMKSGSSEIYTDVSNKIKPLTANRVDGPVLHNDPATGQSWQRSAVQAINTGYRVKS